MKSLVSPSSARSGALVLCGLLLGGAGTAGCDAADPSPTAPSVHPPPPEPILPQKPKIDPDASLSPKWIRQLAAVPPPVEPGQRAWAATPILGTEMASVGIYKVHAINGTTATLVDDLSQKLTGVPGAVIHPLKQSALRIGQWALCHSRSMPAGIARIAKLHKDQIQVQYDLAGNTKQAPVQHAEAAVQGIAPLAFVGFPKAGSMSKGLIVALTKERAWIYADSGHVELHSLPSLTPLKLPTQPWKKGDAVLAYSWVGGFEKGTISQIIEPGLRYGVDLGKIRGEQRYFFTQLIRPSREGPPQPKGASVDG